MEGDRQQQKSESATEDGTAKAKRKVEKLRRQLEKEERRIAKAEAKATKDREKYSAEASTTDLSAVGNKTKKRKRSDSGGSGTVKVGDTSLVMPKLQEAVSIVPDPLTPTSQPALAEEQVDSPAKILEAHSASGQTNSSTGQEGDELTIPGTDRSTHDSSVSHSYSSSDSSSMDSEDNTSSSGSSSKSDSDDSDDGGPDESSTKRNEPESVAPPTRAKPEQLCRAFINKGLCKRGSSCRYLHELPEKGSRGARTQGIKEAEGRKERVRLYQRVSCHAQRMNCVTERVLTT